MIAGLSVTRDWYFLAVGCFAILLIGANVAVIQTFSAKRLLQRPIAGKVLANVLMLVYIALSVIFGTPDTWRVGIALLALLVDAATLAWVWRSLNTGKLIVETANIADELAEATARIAKELSDENIVIAEKVRKENAAIAMRLVENTRKIAERLSIDADVRESNLGDRIETKSTAEQVEKISQKLENKIEPKATTEIEPKATTEQVDELGKKMDHTD